MKSKKRNEEAIKIIRKAKGVTMLALVVTIIVLLILAAITLSLAVGKNGIIARAKLARDKAKNASIAEEEAMNLAAGEIDNAENGSDSGDSGGTVPECPDVSELENTIKELQSTIANLEQQLAAERANKAALEQQIASLNNQIAQLNNELNSKKEQIADLQGQLTSKNQELAKKDETIRNLQATVESLNNQITELNRQIETLKAKQATGNAVAGDVLVGKTFSNSSGIGLVGTMTNNGAINKTLNAGGSYTVPAGYHNGSGKVTAESLANQTPGTATAADIANGKTAWVNGQKILGSSLGSAEKAEYWSGIVKTDAGPSTTYNLERNIGDYTLVACGGASIVQTDFYSNTTFTETGFTKGNNRTTLNYAVLSAFYCLTESKDNYIAEKYSTTVFNTNFTPPSKDGYKIMDVFFTGNIQANKRAYAGLTYNKATNTCNIECGGLENTANMGYYVIYRKIN